MFSYRVLALSLLFFTHFHVLAHEPFEITTVARIQANAMNISVTLNRGAAVAIAQKSTDTVADFPVENFDQLKPSLLEAADRFFLITSGGKKLPLTRASVKLSQEKDLDYQLTFPVPAAGPLTLEFPPLRELPKGFGNALNLTQDNPPAVLSFTLLTADQPGVTVTLAPPPPPLADPAAGAATSQAAPTTAPPPLFKKFLKLGIEHILEGYDHLLFLAGLLVVTRNARSMIAIITCFTLAHSITLALAALDIVVIPGKIVEPLIAASIVFVGVENLLSRGEPKHRWALTFAFGLIHGFGFAGVLRELGFGGEGAGIAVPLLAFNLGVELGQLLIAAVALPLLLLKLHQQNGSLGNQIARALSVIVVLLGGWWLLERTVLS